MEVSSWKYEQKCKENAELKRANAELKRANAEKGRRIAELEAQVRALQYAGAEGTEAAKPGCSADGGQHDRRGLRKYSTREFKDYPRVEGAPRTREYAGYEGGSDFSALVFKTIQRTADILRCPVHGTPLSEKVTDTYGRTTEDAVIGGGWCVTHWTVNRRY